MRPREHKRLGNQVRHFDHDLWQKDCERIVPRGNIAILSQKDEIRLALGHIDQRRLAEACPHDTLWCTGLSAFNLRTSLSDTCLWKTCKKSFVRRPLRHYVTPYCRKRGFHGSHMRHCLARLIRSLTFASITAPNTSYAQTATPSVFTDAVPDDYTTEVRLAHTKCVDAPSCLHKAPI